MTQFEEVSLVVQILNTNSFIACWCAYLSLDNSVDHIAALESGSMGPTFFYIQDYVLLEDLLWQTLDSNT